MKTKCPNCKNDKDIVIHSEVKPEDDRDGLGHRHCECKECGRQFNEWVSLTGKVVGDDVFKKIFGESFGLYK